MKKILALLLTLSLLVTGLTACTGKGDKQEETKAETVSYTKFFNAGEQNPDRLAMVLKRSFTAPASIIIVYNIKGIADGLKLDRNSAIPNYLKNDQYVILPNGMVADTNDNIIVSELKFMSADEEHMKEKENDFLETPGGSNIWKPVKNFYGGNETHNNFSIVNAIKAADSDKYYGVLCEAADILSDDSEAEVREHMNYVDKLTNIYNEYVEVYVSCGDNYKGEYYYDNIYVNTKNPEEKLNFSDVTFYEDVVAREMARVTGLQIHTSANICISTVGVMHRYNHKIEYEKYHSAVISMSKTKLEEFYNLHSSKNSEEDINLAAVILMQPELVIDTSENEKKEFTATGEKFKVNGVEWEIAKDDSIGIYFLVKDKDNNVTETIELCHNLKNGLTTKEVIKLMKELYDGQIEN